MAEEHKVKCDKCGTQADMYKDFLGGRSIPKSWYKDKEYEKVLCRVCSIKYLELRQNFYREGKQ